VNLSNVSLLAEITKNIVFQNSDVMTKFSNIRKELKGAFQDPDFPPN
jgi:hypothetical protein